MKFKTRDGAETQQLGIQLGKKLSPGDVVLLTGPLGAGKSELARGIAKGLGIECFVPSPTFTILNIYQTGEFPLHHFDWYRIENSEELYEAGLDELIGGESLTLIEWHERAPELIPRDCLEILILPGKGDLRTISFLPHGAFRALDLKMPADFMEDK